MVTFTRLMLLAAATGSFCACVPDEDTTSTNQELRTHNRLASNRLASNRLASNRLASNRLASNSLSSTRFKALQETAQILETEEGRDVYSYIVSCSMIDGITIEADVPGAANTAPPDTQHTCVDEHCVFPGSLGLAAGWLDKRLDHRGEGWVSACLFSRVNFHETAEAISLRGRNDALTISQDEAEQYTLEEGAFFGNLFNGADGPIDWNACRGEAEAAGGESGGLELRDCTEENPATPGFTLCGFKYAGDCADYTPAFPSPYACGTFNASTGAYGDCHDEPGNGHWNGGKYREVITVFAAN